MISPCIIALPIIFYINNFYVPYMEESRDYIYDKKNVFRQLIVFTCISAELVVESNREMH